MFQKGTWERVLFDFWSKVRKTTSCWLWTASRVIGPGRRNRNGHARFQIGKDHIYAHRFSWIIHGNLIQRGMDVLHKCDNPMCVRPDHLFVGTVKDNMQDMIRKGRKPSKVTLDQVAEIRRRCDAGETKAALAQEFGISQLQVYRIATRRSWALVS